VLSFFVWVVAGAAGEVVPTHITERMVTYSRRNQAYERRKKDATEVRGRGGTHLVALAADRLTVCARGRRQACAPLMRLFGECTQRHGMWAVVWSCRAENIAMNECMKEECVLRH
jgi:hypothetical protein